MYLYYVPFSHLPQDCSSVKEAEEWYGYSYARTPAKFRQSFGNDDELMEVQHAMLNAAFGEISE